MTEETVPLTDDLAAAGRLGRAAILSRPWVGSRGPALADQFEEGLRSGGRQGAIYRTGGRAAGISVWEAHGPLGVEVNLLYLDPALASIASYERFWAGLRALAGPIALVPGELPGLTRADEERLMRGLGFARYGRSEMRLRDDVRIADPELPPEGTLRRVGTADAAELTRLHRIAYHDRFDRYLFLEDGDEGRDSERMVRDLFAGRWGEFDPIGSWGVEVDGRLLGAVLCVNRSEGVLVADVMVDPALQGRHIGRTVMLGALAGLLAAHRVPVYLNVTEGNVRAVRLYEGLGFVRSLGPSLDWYHPDQIPVAP